MTLKLKVDPQRNVLAGDPVGDLTGGTGIYVRALRDGKYESADIAELDADSLRTWLRSRGGENLWAEAVVAHLLGHDMEKWGPME